MKKYIISLIQFMIWSIYSIVEWYAKYDGTKSKLILLFIFSYFAFIIAGKMGLTKKGSMFLTIFTMGIFFVSQHLFWTYII